MAGTIPPIPDPGNDLTSIKQAVLALKQAVEILAGMRGNKANSAATQAQITSILDRLHAHGI